MPVATIKFHGFKKIEHALDDKRFSTVLRAHIRKANVKIGLHARKTVRDVVKSSILTKNRPLTIAIKGSEKSMVDRGDFWQSLTYKVISDLQVFVGVLQQSAEYNIAKVLHDGVVIPVTPQMRGLFWALWQVSIGAMPKSNLSERGQELIEQMPEGWKPLKDSTTAIIIPSRPFIRIAFENKSLEAYARQMWSSATAAAFKELSTKG